jgi:predicted MPP superfamily phosphohydrolase
MARRFPAGKPAAICAVVVAAVCALNFFALRPLYERGSLDRSAVLINVTVTMASLPGLVAGRALFVPRNKTSPGARRSVVHGNRLSEGFLRRYYLVVTLFTAATFWALAWVFFRSRQRRKERETPPSAGATSNAGRRIFLRRAAGWSVVGGLGALGGYTLWIEPRWPRVRRVRLPLRGLPRELVGLRVAHMTDLHLGRFNSAGYLRGVVERCNALRPDLVLLTGDLVHGSPRFIPRVAEVIGGLTPRLATLAVLGNHDHWEGEQKSRRAIRGAGVRLVENRRFWVDRHRISARALPGALCVAGVGDLWEGRTDLDGALGGVDPETPRLLLAHNPDFAETTTARESSHRVDLMLAGHTHGGQVRLLGAGSLISPSRYGSKYDEGFVDGPRFKVFVSVGVGTTILPVRFRVRPEVVLFELERK